MFASHAFLPATTDIPLTLGFWFFAFWSWEAKPNLPFWREKNRDFETKGVELSPSGGPLPEWEGNRN